MRVMSCRLKVLLPRPHPVALTLIMVVFPVVELSAKNAIEVGSIDNLVDTLLAVREAIVTGELDAQIEAASGAVRAGFKKK